MRPLARVDTNWMNNVLRLRTLWLAAMAAVLTACTTTPKPKEPPTPSYVITAPDATPLGRQVAALRPRAVPAGQSGLFLLGQGVEAFSARVGLAQRATRTLDVQYYAVFNDESGTLLLGRVDRCRPAQRSRSPADRRPSRVRARARPFSIGFGAWHRSARLQSLRRTRICASSVARVDRRW